MLTAAVGIKFEDTSRSHLAGAAMALSNRGEMAPPEGCSFLDKTLVVSGVRIPFIHFKHDACDEIWMPAKPVMKTTGETTITQILDRVFCDDKMTFEDLVTAKGLPLEGCYGFVTPPNVSDYNEKKAIWVNESGFYAMVLGSRKPHCVTFQRWVLHVVLPSIRRTGSYLSLPTSSSSGTFWRTGFVDASNEKVAARKKRSFNKPLEDASELLRDIVARTTKLEGKELKLRLIYVSAVFADLVMREHEGVSSTELERRYGLNSAFGARVRVPSADLPLALASVKLTEESSGRAVSLGLSGSSSSVPQGASWRKPGFCVKTEEHHRAKDDANELWIRFLPRSKLDACFFFLDAFKEEHGFVLRTTSALLAHGFDPRQLYSANPDKGVFLALREAGVHCFEGTWREASWSRAPVLFDGIYLDLCAGSAGYVSQQLELATVRAASGCVMAWTLTERDFEGEDILLRVAGLEDMLRSRMWTPAAGGSMRESLLVHKCGASRQRVVTQLWRYCG